MVVCSHISSQSSFLGQRTPALLSVGDLHILSSLLVKRKGDHVCFRLVRGNTCASAEWDNKAAGAHSVIEQSFPK